MKLSLPPTSFLSLSAVALARGETKHKRAVSGRGEEEASVGEEVEEEEEVGKTERWTEERGKRACKSGTPFRC